MSDGQTEFLIFAQVGAALGALCLLPVIIGRLIRRVRGQGPETGPVRYGARAHLPEARAAADISDVLVPEPSERTRIRTLEYDAIQSRVAARRASALRELRELGSEDSVTTMLVAVLDPNHAVRSEAAEGIASLADPDAVEPLVHAVATSSPRASSARAAILGLGQVAVPELQRLEREATEPEMRQTAAVLEEAIG